ncbi:hypothetical protein [Synechocystis sp. PCC 7509]|uniref:hypothetical protein n=1 Tax=Synechocystis sp. PCC 7509 TaxID=927677 RepID=UPI0002ACA1CA|nr:hypothetical protein [Synechocystis sp. PCC 7509]
MQSKDIENQDIVKTTDANSDRFVDKSKKQLLTSDLRWTAAEMAETYYRLIAFKDDWDAPGMEAYD